MKPIQFSSPILNHRSTPEERQAVLRQMYSRSHGYEDGVQG